MAKIVHGKGKYGFVVSFEDMNGKHKHYHWFEDKEKRDFWFEYQKNSIKRRLAVGYKRYIVMKKDK